MSDIRPTERRRRADLVLIGAVLAVALGWFACSRLVAGPADTAVVVCQSQDGFYRADSLDSDVSYTVTTPGTGIGADADEGANTVRIAGGCVDVTYANCSNQVCADHAPIDEVGEQIVCLPHGVVIEIVEREQDATRLA